MKYSTTMIAILAGCCLAGCQSATPVHPVDVQAQPVDVRAPQTIAVDPLPTDAYPQIVLHNDLQTVLVIQPPVVVQPSTAMTPMSVKAQIRSMANREIQVRYRFIFLGSDGLPLDVQPAWKTELLPARTARVFSAAAISSRAADWKLEMSK